MAAGALRNASGRRVSVAVTGVAGPGGGSQDKPVGLVHLAAAMIDPQAAAAARVVAHVERGYGAERTRAVIRSLTVLDGLELLRQAAEEWPARSDA